MSSQEQYIARRRDDGTEQSITEHLEGTAKLAERFADAFGAGAMARVCGMCHDVGKYSARFQRRIRGANVRVDHSTAGAQLLKEQYPQSPLALIAAYCIMGHHGGLPDGGDRVQALDDDPTLYGRLKREIEDYSAYKNEVELPQLKHPEIVPKDGFGAAFFTRMMFSALVDADRLDTEAFMRDNVKRGAFCDIAELKNRLFSQIERYINPPSDASELNKKRSALLNNCIDAASQPPGLFTLTAPTGSGKTIASLAFALAHAAEHGKRRVIYVVPYNTIIEQNAKVFEEYLGAENVLQHHSNVRCDDDGVDEASDRKRCATENWDYPLIVTSSVRFFESLFANRTSDCRKLHNVANSIVIFDEAQMLPLPYLRPCVRAITELVQNYGCTAVLTTATQANLQPFLNGMTPREITAEPQKLNKFLRRAVIKRLDEPLTDDALSERLCAYPQVLCIVNTRKQAQTLFAKLAEKTDGNDGVFHLSTTMYPNHRSEVLKQIRERLNDGRPCRVVSTSLVEAGVDLDFPTVYRAEAGLDSVVQAAGRCNREGKRDKDASVLYVFSSAEHNVPQSIKPNVAATDQVLREHSDAASLDAITAYFAQLYYNKGDEALDAKCVLAKFEEQRKTLSFPFRSVADDFNIIEQDTQTLYVLCHASPESESQKLAERLRKGERSRELFRKLDRYSVSLYCYNVAKLGEIGALERLDGEILLLTKPYYDDRFGVTLSPAGGDAVIC